MAFPVFGQQPQDRDEYIIERTLRVPSGSVHEVLQSPDEQLLVTLGGNHTLRLWDPETGRVVREIATGDHQARVATYHPQAGVIFTAGTDNNVIAWDVASGRAQRTYAGANAPLLTLTTDSTGARLFGGGRDGRVYAWDSETGELLAQFEANPGGVTTLALHPDGLHLASGGDDQAVRVWDWKAGEEIVSLVGHNDSITAVEFAFQSELLISASTDGTIKLWNWEAVDDPLVGTLMGHTRAVSDIVVHPNGEWLLSASPDEKILVWNIGQQQLLQELALADGPITAIHLSASGQRLISAYDRDRARTWTLEKSAFLTTLEGHEQSVVSMDFADTSRYLISASPDKTVRIWDIKQLQVVRTYETENHAVQTVRFAPGDRTFATGGTDGVIQIWDTDRGNITHRLTGGHSGKINAIAFHPSGTRLVSAGSDKIWVLWDIESSRPLKRVSGHLDQVTAVVFAPDGQQFATGGEDGAIRIWEFPSGTLLQTLLGHSAGIQDLAYNPSGNQLASGSRDGTVRIWHPRDSEQLFEFTGHDFIVSGLRFTPDGQSLVSVSWDKTVKLWDVQNGKLLRTLTGERDQIVSMALSPDGMLIATGSVEPGITLLVYPLEAELAQHQASEIEADLDAEKNPAAEETDAARGELEIDIAAPLASPDAGDERAIRPGGSDTAPAQLGPPGGEDAANLGELEARLNTLLAMENYCASASELGATAFQILEQAPYDQAAYEALLNTSIVLQDLKLIYLVTKIGQHALFLNQIYDYATAEQMASRFAFWQEEVFDPARNRAGTELVLNFVGCDGRKNRVLMPSELYAVDLPREVLQRLLSPTVRVDFRPFQLVSDTLFLDRLDYLTSQVADVLRRGQVEDQITQINPEQAPVRQQGVLQLDLSDIDIFGYPGKTVFRLRKANSLWLTYHTDRDRRKELFLPTGDYYLMVDQRVRKIFRIQPEQAVPIVVATR